jgi:two-component system response regulator FixJ
MKATKQLEQEFNGPNLVLLQKVSKCEEVNTPMIYVIDDGEDMCPALDWLLHETGYTIRIFSHIADFLDSYNKRPGCLILCVQFPHADRLSFVRELLWRNIDLPVIVVSENGDEKIEANALKSGAIGFIAKPCNAVKLTELVRAAVEENLMLREFF